MQRANLMRALAHARVAGTALLSIAVMFALLVLAIGAVMGERRR